MLAWFLGMVAVGAVLSYVAIPVATVTVAAATEPLAETVEIRGEPTLSAPDQRRQAVPIRLIYAMVEGSEVVPATGRRMVLLARAEGWVTLMNHTGQPLTVPRGTVLVASNGARFETTEERRLAAADEASAKVWIVAKDAGEQANVRRGEITRVEGPLARGVVAMNEDEVSGGGGREAELVTAGDQQKVRQLLLGRLEQIALQQLKGQLKPDEAVPPETLHFTIVREDYDHQEGEQAKALGLRIQARVRGSAFSPKAVSSLAEQVWQPRIKPGFSVPASTIRQEPAAVARTDDSTGTITIAVPMRATAVARINRERVESGLRWATEAEALRLLADTLPLARPPTIQVAPDWAQRAMRVHLVIDDSTWKSGN